MPYYQKGIEQPLIKQRFAGSEEFGRQETHKLKQALYEIGQTLMGRGPVLEEERKRAKK